VIEFTNIEHMFDKLKKGLTVDKGDPIDSPGYRGLIQYEDIPYDDLNVGCPESCMSCLLDAIEIVESGDWQNPNATGPLQRCDAHNPADTMHGHYQIGRLMIQDAQSLCKGGGGLPKVTACCGIPKNAYAILSTNCNGNASCCDNKKALGQLIIDCWRRRWTRNQGKGACGWSKCDGSGGPSENESGRHKYTCEDLAKMHKEGVCGHKCCESPGCCGENVSEVQQEAEGGNACARANQYWERVQSVMNQICPNCEDTNPPEGYCCEVDGTDIGEPATYESCENQGGTWSPEPCTKFDNLSVDK